MPATRKRRPPMDTIREGSAAEEQAESAEEQASEGPESQESSKGTNRKRSAKNAKRTKAPMDSDCGCGGGKGKKCSCNDGCGDYKKMDSALTAQEYLTACDLGIQDRSRSYIRTRLITMDSTTLRADKKCGNSSIPDDRQCRSGGGTLGKVATGAAILGGAAAAYGAFKHRKQIGAMASSAAKSTKFAARRAGVKAQRVGRVARRVGTNARSAAAGVASNVRSAASNGMEYANSRSFKRSVARTTRPVRQTVRRVGSSVSRVGTSVRSRFSRDSVWAVGFEPGDFQ